MDTLSDVTAETTELISYLGLTGIEQAEAASLSYGGQRLLDMGLALATRPRILLLDEPLAGLAAAERQRIAALVKTISAEIPVLLVEHDIDRVFQIADHVTVMNEGRVLVDGSVDDHAQRYESARGLHRFRRRGRRGAIARLSGRLRATAHDRWYRDVLWQEPHPQCGLARRVRARDRRAARPQRRGQINLAENPDRHRAADRLDQPTGREYGGFPSAEIARRGIGYVPQGVACSPA